MEKIKKEQIGDKDLLKSLTQLEMYSITGGGGRWRSWLRSLGRKAGELFPCYCSTGINSSNYEYYLNPNDPLM